MNCPKCGSDDWKYAFVIHAAGKGIVSGAGVGTGIIGTSGGGVGLGLSLNHSSEEFQTDLSKLAAPPIKKIRPAFVFGFIFSILGVVFIFINGDVALPSVVLAIFLLLFGLCTPAINNKFKEDNVQAQREYEEKKICLKCGTAFGEEAEKSLFDGSGAIKANKSPVIEVSRAVKKCPFCAEFILEEAVFCKHCRNNLTAEIKN